jgi:hypothetical protein
MYWRIARTSSRTHARSCRARAFLSPALCACSKRRVNQVRCAARRRKCESAVCLTGHAMRSGGTPAGRRSRLTRTVNSVARASHSLEHEPFTAAACQLDCIRRGGSHASRP